MNIPHPRARLCLAALLSLALALPHAQAQRGRTEEDTSLEIFEEEGFSDETKIVYARNTVNRPVFVEFDIEGTQYLGRISPSLPVRARIPANASRHQLVTYEWDLEPGERGQINFSYRTFMSDPQANHDDDHAYVFPWAHGETREIGQAYRGRRSHQRGTQSEYALDFEMDVGTPVHAARGGLVVAAVEDKRGRSRIRDGDPGNHVYVLHDDDTLGSYAHLRRNGVEVSVGDTVTTGQLLGHSGNTGSSTGPHLHFQVSRGVGQSLPVRFRMGDGSTEEGRNLRAGQDVTSNHPGRAPQQASAGAGDAEDGGQPDAYGDASGDDASTLGQDAGEGEGSEQTSRVQIEEPLFVEVDRQCPDSSRCTVFLVNRSSQEVEVRVRFVLENALTSTGDTTFTLSIPAGERREVTEITQVYPGDGWTYRVLRLQILD